LYSSCARIPTPFFFFKRFFPIQKPSRNTTPGSEDFPWETAEKRPIISSEAIEKGEDYWIDERDLVKEKERQEAIKNRLASFSFRKSDSYDVHEAVHHSNKTPVFCCF
jgi:hypothetical protein